MCAFLKVPSWSDIPHLLLLCCFLDVLATFQGYSSVLGLAWLLVHVLWHSGPALFYRCLKAAVPSHEARSMRLFDLQREWLHCQSSRQTSMQGSYQLPAAMRGLVQPGRNLAQPP